MKTNIWLTLNRSGVVKMTQGKPTLGPKQRAVRLTITIPEVAFQEPPMLDAELIIPPEALAYPAITEPVGVEIWP